MSDRPKLPDGLPEPTWSDDEFGIALYRGDCLDILPTMPDGCVDAVVTDPPYGVGFRYKSGGDDRAQYLRLVPQWFDAMKRWPIMVTCGVANLGVWPPCRWTLAWLKKNAMGANRLSGPKAVSRNLWEPILWFSDSYPNHPPSRDIIHAPLIPSVDCVTGHPCPKPLALFAQLVEMATTKSALDPFMGSGTTGVACVRLGRAFIGIELEPKYFDICVERISQAIVEYQGGPMFAKHRPATLFDEEKTA